MISLAVIDDDQMLLDGLRAWINGVEDVRVSSVAHTVDEFFAGGPDGIDVVILDMLLADRSDPVANVRRIDDSGLRVLAVSVVPSAELGRQVTRAGACGYLTKDHDLEGLMTAIREVHSNGAVHSPELALAWLTDRAANRPHLSKQELAVVVAYASGMTLTAAARSVGVQPATAKGYLDRVKDKYREAGRPVFTKLDLAARVREDGLEWRQA